jgi:hypothetical protein
MKDLEGYYDELQLQEMLINGEIKKIDYILHHDEDMTEDYRDFCKEKHLEYGSDASADVYFSYMTDQEEKEMKAGSSSFGDDGMNDDNNSDHVDNKEVPYCVKIYNEWNNDPDLIEEMKNDMDATYVTRWRLLNPMDNNMDDCMKKCDLDEDVVNKWWDVINYIIGANGGYPVTPLNYNMNTIKQIINNAIPRKQN